MNEKRRPKEPRGADVGYGNPPKHTQFQKGRSGNPKGRPKGALNVNTVFQKTVREKVIINENGNRKEVTKFEAGFKQLANKSASGDLRAIGLQIALARTLEERMAQTSATDNTLGEVDAKVVQGILDRLQNANKTKKKKKKKKSETEKGEENEPDSK